MKTTLISITLLITICVNVAGQNLVGYDEKEIRQIMKEKYKNMIFRSYTDNNTFKYLKYSDESEIQTLLFFLNPDSFCRSVRLVCDKSLRKKKIKEYNANYEKSGKNTWIETKNGKKYNIELRDEEWSFSVTITLKE